MEKEDKVEGVAPNPDSVFELTAQEYLAVIGIKRNLLKCVNLMEELEQKFHSQGKLAYFKTSDIIQEDNRSFLRKDFWETKVDKTK